MPAFEYLALDQNGREKKGILEGDSARQIRSQLRDQGLSPLAVDESNKKEKNNAGDKATGSFRGSLKTAELSLIIRQIATLTSAGTPLEESLAATAKHSEKNKVKSLLLTVRSKLMEGHTFAEALSQYPKVFPEMFRATVSAGEQSGHLDGVLERLADFSEDRQSTEATVKKALVYPVFLVVISIAIVGLMLAVVVPKVVETFDDLGQELPGITLALIAASEFVQAWGLVVVIAAVIGIIAFNRAMLVETFKFKVHKFLLQLPIAGKLVRSANAASFARTLSILAASGVPVLEALDIASQVISNRPMRQAVLEASAKVREGTSLSRALENSRQFPPMLLHLIASGEGSGRLGFMLEKAANHLEREQDTAVSSALGILQPTIVLIMGAAILAIVLGILLPIFELNDMVG